MIIEFEARIAKHARELLELIAVGKANDPLYHYINGAKEEAEYLQRFYEKQMSGHIANCHGQKGEKENEKNHTGSS